MMRLLFILFAGYVAYRVIEESGPKAAEAPARSRSPRRRPPAETKSGPD